MIKEAINLKVLEIAVKKRDFPFLSRKLVELLDKYQWSEEEVAELARHLTEEPRRRAGSSRNPPR